MPFIHDIGLNGPEDGWEQNWYPKTKSFIVRDNHCDCMFSIDFSKSDKHTLPPADQNALYCLTIPLRMVCTAELMYYEGEPWKVRIRQVEEAEALAEGVSRGRHKERGRMYFQEQSVHADNSSRQESAH